MQKWPIALLAGISALGLSLASAGPVVSGALIGALVLFLLRQEEPHARIGAHNTDEHSAVTAKLPKGYGQKLLADMPFPIILLSAQGRVIYGNPAAVTLLPNMALNQHISSIFRAPVLIEAIRSVRETGEKQRITYDFPSGHRFFVLEIATLTPLIPGDAAQLILKIEDKTEDRLALQAQSDFIANSSHELKTPLATIMGYIETLQGHAKNDPKAQERFLKTMDKQAKRMDRLICDLLTLSRIEAKRGGRPTQTHDLMPILAAICLDLEPLCEKYNGEISLEALGNAPLLLPMDPEQMTQLFTNVIENALRYGGQEPRIWLTRRDDDPRFPDMVGIMVEDNGEGIESRHLPRLTERFYRIDPSKSKRRNGTGLGLAIVRQILTRHGGELEITSTLGAGSCFTIWLPDHR